MASNTRNKIGTIAAAVAVAMLLGAGCGDDDEDAGGPSGSTADTGEEPTTTSGEDGEEGEGGELCAVAEELFNQDDFPSADQIRRYQELAPEELAEATQVAGAPFLEHEGDPVAIFAGLADDDVEAAMVEINAFEEAECGIDHDTDAVGPNEAEEGATAVDVVASEYSFAIPDGIAAGRTSFVMTNDGAEAHFMVLTRILEGTLEEALAFEGDPAEAGLVEDVGDSGIAAPGGDDVEVLTADLEAGDYGMLCFVPGPDGTPHAFMGMAVPFTVS